MMLAAFLLSCTRCLGIVVWDAGFTMRGSPLRLIAVAGGAIMAGVFTLSFTTSVSIQAFQAVLEFKKKKTAPRCTVCKGKGLIDCRLCHGRSVIDWTPLYNPPVTSPCLCPTCDGNRVQRCLNCAGRGYTWWYLIGITNVFVNLLSPSLDQLSLPTNDRSTQGLLGFMLHSLFLLWEAN